LSANNRRFGGAVEFLLGQLDEPVDVLDVALLQKLVGQHRHEGRRKRHADAKVHPFVNQLLKDLDQRDVRFRDRLEQPALFQEPVVFGMPDERQMRVQYERQVSFE